MAELVVTTADGLSLVAAGWQLLQLYVRNLRATDSLQPAAKAYIWQSEGKSFEMPLRLTKVANSLRGRALLEYTVSCARGAEYPSTRSTMMPPCEEVERHVTLVTSLNTIIG